MKAIFSNPPWWLSRNEKNGKWTAGVRAGSRWPFSQEVDSAPDDYRWGGYMPMPFFLAYAASYAQAKCEGAEIRFRDSIALRESYASWLAYLKDERPDFLVVESATPSWPHDQALLQDVRAMFPYTQIIVTGPIVIERGAEIVASGLAVAAIKGEFEKGCVRVLNGERGVLEHDLLTVQEMNTASPPWLDEQHAYLYCDTNPRGQLFPHLQVFSSRGCPFRCCFCVWPAAMTGNDATGEGERTVRYYTQDYMEAYLTEAVQRFGFKSIYDDSDTFNLGTKHTEAMCRAYKKVGLPWSAMCRCDTIKRDTWMLMKESGCFGVKLGFESGSQYVVDKIVNKHLDLKEARKTVFLLKRLGMTVHGTFTFGHPGETPEQMQETVEYIKSMPLDSYQTSGVAEIEGTPLSTLSKVGSLKKYPGAIMDSGYRRETDGSVKMQLLVTELQNG